MTHARRHGPARRVRLIGGSWRRTAIPVVDLPGLRPTPDRVRETLFNWLGQRLDGLRCVDAFAGTGALAFEAASRGAVEVIAIESHPRAVAALEALRARLDARAVEVVRGDGIEAMCALARARAGEFDLVFLDPPFGSQLLARALPLAAALLGPGGHAYVEAARACDRALLEAWSVDCLEPVRAGRAGHVYYHLLEKVDSQGE
ncbi:MAG: 16S rRNA (guanine(966)-N(2))-methyltransferase RsmD [Burkholderiales bacterium]|nr:MAG: 16S rRNA (guanine(966)-N(2))-methyltransferase RsmD [Burkholderiales bacterium]